MTDSLLIAAVGDVIFTRPPSPRLALGLMEGADFRTANLEGPITDHAYPADKLIPLKMPPEAAGWVRDAGFDVVSLANNHAMDFGARGLLDTVDRMAPTGVGLVGGGADLDVSLAADVREVRGVRIATLGLSATVPSGFAAGRGRPGIAPIRVHVSFAVDGALNEEQPGTPPWVHTRAEPADLERALAAVRAARAVADLVVVHLHWGVPPEWNSPFQGDLAEYQRPLGHALVEAGAHLIVGHHAHALQGAEVHRGALILFSLGNFAFHPYADRATFELQRPAPPFKVRKTERNRQSVVARVHFERDGAGWSFREARLRPALLNELAEAEAVGADRGATILAAVTGSDANHGVAYTLDAGEAVLRPA
jgi:hypothetical protein